MLYICQCCFTMVIYMSQKGLRQVGGVRFPLSQRSFLFHLDLQKTLETLCIFQTSSLLSAMLSGSMSITLLLYMHCFSPLKELLLHVLYEEVVNKVHSVDLIFNYLYFHLAGLHYKQSTQNCYSIWVHVHHLTFSFFHT